MAASNNAPHCFPFRKPTTVIIFMIIFTIKFYHCIAVVWAQFRLVSKKDIPSDSSEVPVSTHAYAHVESLSCVWLFATLWTAVHQAPLSMGFSRQEYWSGLPFPSPGDLPDSGIEPMSPALAGRFFTTEPPRSPVSTRNINLCEREVAYKPVIS